MKLPLSDEIGLNNTMFYKPKIADYLTKLIKNKFFEPKNYGKLFKKFNLYPKKSHSKVFNKNNFKKTVLFAD